MSLNSAQKLATVPTQSCWVMASAGTGKTKILIDRILHLLLKGAASERIVCMTYTKAAALEMSERLLQKLHHWSVCDDATLQAELASLEAAEHLGLARTLFHTVFASPPKIQTIHSFCQSLLLKNPFAVDLLPDFTILSEKEQKERVDAALDQVVKQDDLHDPLLIISNFMGEAYLKTCLRECLANRLKITASPDLTRWIETNPSPSLRRNALRHAAQSILEKGIKNLKEKAERFLEVTTSSPNPTDPLHDFSKHEALFDLFLTNEGTPRKALEAEYSALTHSVAAYKIARDTQALIEFHKAFDIVLHRFLETYAYTKKQANAVDFDDVLEKVLSLLKDNQDGDFLRRLDASFDHLMLDEAQDTSPIQWEIVLNLLSHFFETPATNQAPFLSSSDEAERRSGDLKDPRLKAEDDRGGKHAPRTVFVVGDRKQSIYSFQGADPEGYLHAKRHINELLHIAGFTLQEIDLTTCYRSTPEILTLVDQMLQRDMIKQSVGASTPHHPHRIQDNGHIELTPLLKEHTAIPITPWHLPRYPDAVMSEEEELAELLANRIGELLQNHIVLPTTGQPIIPSDIFILVKRRTRLLNFIDRALKKRTIPCAGLDRITLYEHLYVQDLIALLAFLDLPEDDLNLAALLKSPLLGFSEEDLIRLYTSRQENSLWHALQADTLSHEAVTFLKTLQDLAKTSSLYELVHHISHLALPRARHVFGSVVEDLSQALLSLALDYESESIPSLAGFLAYIQDEGQNIPLTTQEGVRLMTIHGAKGLEAPVVILADAGDAAIATHSPVLFIEGSYVIRTSHGVLQPIKDTEKQKLIAENHRLLYVAMTRARDYLMLWGIDRGVEDCWHNLVSSFVEEKPLPFKSNALPKTESSHDEMQPPTLTLLKNERLSVKDRTSTRESERGVALHKLFEMFTRHGTISDEILSHPPFQGLTHEDLAHTKKLGTQLALNQGYSELSLTTQDGQTLRLDFVKITDTAIILLDYKSSKAHHASHTAQVQSYMQALQNLFPTHTITAQLVYVESEEIVDVQPKPSHLSRIA